MWMPYAGLTYDDPQTGKPRWLRRGHQLEMVFPSAFCPRYTVVAIDEEAVTLRGEGGSEEVLLHQRVRDWLTGGNARVVQPHSSRQWVTIHEAMDVTKKSRRTIYHWLDSGKVDYVRTAGGQVRIDQATLHIAGNVTPVNT